MYIIKYYNTEVIENKLNNNTNEYEERKELKELEYKCKDDEFEYWLDVIQKTYGKYGEVTYTYEKDKPTTEDVLIKIVNTLAIENKKKDAIIAQLMNGGSN